jgi:polyisoprenoid-binding protein YceI
MNRKILIGAAAAVVLVVAVLALTIFRAPEEASSPIEAIPIATTVADAPTTVPTTASQPTTAAEPTIATEPTTAAAEPTVPAAATGENIIFEIVQDGSEARFVINEVLRGSPTVVTGTTNQVAGQIAINPGDPAATQLGVIQINARTLAPDNNLRNRAIKNFILQTDSYEFVTFTPTTMTGLPTAGAVGETYTFQITGDLTIKDVTKPVTFDVTVTPISETRLEGSATTTIQYADFNLSIPDSPQVDTVEDSVNLHLDFVAQPAA